MKMKLSLLLVRRLALAAGLMLLASEPAMAHTGVISGQARSNATGQPLAGVQIFIPQLNIGSLSQANGRYTIDNVPAGTHTVTAERIGYSAQSVEVEVGGGMTQVLDFDLAEAALALDEIVVTGPAGGTQRRAIGNVVGTVNAASRAEVAPITNVLELVSQQNPGVSTPGFNGLVGAGTAVRIRGNSSIALGSNPILVVDGVRVDNDPETGPNLRGGRQGARMLDFDPDDIESIEIIKGPAAATLYGTEASNGVIQIITKQGVAGAPAVEFAMRQGLNYMDDPQGRFFTTYDYDAASGRLDSMNVYTLYEQQTGQPIFDYGHLQGYDLSLRGGTEQLRYYVSAGYDDETGIVDYNWREAVNTRANISITPSAEWDITTSMGFSRSDTRFAQASTGQGIWEAIVWTHPNNCDRPTMCFHYLTPDAASTVESLQKVGRFTGSVQVTHQPLEWLNQRLTMGLDYVGDRSTKLFPKVPEGEINYFGGRGGGEKEVEEITSQFATLDWGATASFDLTPSITSATSVGIQYYQRQTATSHLLGSGFPALGLSTVSSAATRTSDESWIENKTLGTYIQQQIGWQDRLFVTGAVRGDDNSAFGADFDAAIYPKFSATWVLSEEDFFDVDVIDQLRLRSAWGKAGQQPGVFDAVTLYTPVTGPGGAGALTPRSLWDPGLKPEVGSEIELGFDAAVLDERLSVEFTYYSKSTKDALVPRVLRPSSGFQGSQLVNVGEIANWGTEIGLSATVLNSDDLGLDLGLAFATHENEIKDLGELPEQGGSGTRQFVGYPVNGFFAQIAVSGDLAPGASRPTNMMCYGGTGPGNHGEGGSLVPCGDAPVVLHHNRGPEPTWSGNQTVNLRLGQNLRFGSVVEFMGGHVARSMIAGAHRSMNSTLAVNPTVDPRIAYYLTQGNNNIPGQFKAGWARLRELSAAYTLPESIVSRAGVSRASLVLAWRNVAFLWREEKFIWGSQVFDPEQTGAGDDTTVNQIVEFAPTSRVQMSMRVTF